MLEVNLEPFKDISASTQSILFTVTNWEAAPTVLLYQAFTFSGNRGISIPTKNYTKKTPRFGKNGYKYKTRFHENYGMTQE